uniref:Uncharacterized protein n=1 Tax=Anguilla anguilla TaxID=7936 RepID=A0A0E9SMS0_ANGAN
MTRPLASGSLVQWPGWWNVLSE